MEGGTFRLLVGVADLPGGGVCVSENRVVLGEEEGELARGRRGIGLGEDIAVGTSVDGSAGVWREVEGVTVVEGVVEEEGVRFE